MNVLLEPTLHMMWLNCTVVMSEIFSGPVHVSAEDRGPAEAAWCSVMDPRRRKVVPPCPARLLLDAQGLRPHWNLGASGQHTHRGEQEVERRKIR